MKKLPATLCARISASFAFVALALAIGAPVALGQGAGSLDTTFNIGPVTIPAGAVPVATTVAVQADAKIIFGGINLSTVDSTDVRQLIRTNPDGSLDTSFTPPVIESYNTRTDTIVTKLIPSYIPTIEVVAPQPNGKILVGGSFYFINGTGGFGGLVRLNADGSYDKSFVPPRFNGTVYAITRTSDGHYLIGGDFGLANANTRSGIVRLTASGSLDTVFDPGAFTGTLLAPTDGTSFPSVRSIVLQPDGGILIGGIFSEIQGKNIRGLARLNADGTFDSTFVPYSGFNPPATGQSPSFLQNQILALALQADGKVLVGGYFVDTEGSTTTAINSLYRLNSDGSQDTSFAVGDGTADEANAGASTYVNAIALQSDGKIVIGGGFKSYQDQALFALARVNTDGSLDTSFDIKDGPDQTVQALAFQADGQLLIGGYFLNYINSEVTVPAELVARVNTGLTSVAPGIQVSVAANDTKALVVESGDVSITSTKGVFTFTRSGGNLALPLTAYVTFSGTAQPGVNYKQKNKATTVSGFPIAFASGSSTAALKISALFQGSSPDMPTVVKTVLTATVAPYGTYVVGPSPSATIKVVSKAPAEP